MEQQPIIIQPDEVVNIVKNGENVINVGLIRSTKGLSLTVRTHPHVEDFFRNASVGEPQDVRGLGRYWAPLDPNANLFAYQVALEPLAIELSTGQMLQARFDRVGRLLSEHENEGTKYGGGPTTINMSFLRLVGISEGTGVTFRLKGVYSDQQVKAYWDAIQSASKRFYMAYLKPINLYLSVVTQEI